MPANILNVPDKTSIQSNNFSASDAPEKIAFQQRRHLAKLGLAAPVLMTIASRPVFGAQCLSNMMSGNLSNPNRGNCAAGRSPGGWGQPGGNIFTYTTVGAWTAIGLLYGNLTPGKNASQYRNYTGGSTMADVPAVLNQDGVPTATTLRDVLAIDPSSRQKTRHLVAAYMNAKLSALPGSTFHYILTVQQVLDLAAGTIVPPLPYTDINTFLDSTWT